MKNISIYIMLLSFGILTAQRKLDVREKNLDYRIKEIGQYFIKQDYNLLANAICPEMITYIGSKDSVVYMFKKIFDEGTQRGVSYSSVVFKQHSKIYNFENKLQCTVQMITELKRGNTRVVTESTLIMFSHDNGQNWCFVSGDDNDDFMKKLNLSPKIVIPKIKQSVYKNK